MKINVVHKEGRFQIDVLASQKIWQVKEIISKALNLNLIIRHEKDKDKDNEEEYKENDSMGMFHLYYNASTLNDNCAVAEVGLMSGSTVRCRQIHTSPYSLKIRVKCLSKDLDLRDEISIEKATIGDLRTYLQNRLGIPVSIFNLKQTWEKRDLFDIRLLSYYGIKHGDTLILDVWNGTEDFIIAALNDDISQTLVTVPSYHDNPVLNRYYLKVALFVAAHFDFVNLAAQVLQRGARCDEPVSEYPSRQWCLQQAHPEVFKTPIHQASMKGSFRILNIFLRHSPTCIVAKDGYGRSPSTYASLNGHMECWKLLMVAQFQFQSICGFSLIIYAKIMKWCNKARDRVLYFKAENKKQLLLQSQLHPPDFTCLGDPIVISGFHGNMADEDERTRINKLSVWSYNLNKNETCLHKSSTRVRYDPSSIMESEKSVVSKVVPYKPLRSSKSLNEADLSKSRGVQSKYHRLRSNTLSDLSADFRSLASDKRMSASQRSSKQNARIEARRIIFKTTGKTPNQIANECFQVGQSFDKMKWRSQMSIALKCSLNSLGKNGGLDNDS